MSKPRKHHYLSQSYLKRFSKNGSKKSQLIVVDLVERRYFKSKPDGIGCKRDFNRIDSDNLPPDYLENNILSKFEGYVSRSIDEVENTRNFEGKNKNIILRAISAFAIRNPWRRAHWSSVMENIYKRLIGEMIHRDIFIKNGMSKEDSIKLKDLHEKDGYTVNTPREQHISLELKSLDTVLSCLVDRKWKLFISHDDDFFISSDNPVMLDYFDPDKIPPMHRNSPGFCLLNTFVIFPLTRNLLLLGSFEGSDGCDILKKEDVAFFNSITIHKAVKQIFAPNEKFLFLDNNEKVLFGADSLFKEFEKS